MMKLGTPKDPTAAIAVTYYLLPEERALAEKQLEASAVNPRLRNDHRSIAGHAAGFFRSPAGRHVPKVVIRYTPLELALLAEAIETDNGLGRELGYVRTLDVLAGNIRHELARRGLPYPPKAEYLPKRRRYRVWAGSPDGTPEDRKRCVVSVADDGRSPLSHQCNRPRGHGPDKLYCASHAKALEAGKPLHVPEPR